MSTATDEMIPLHLSWFDYVPPQDMPVITNDARKRLSETKDISIVVDEYVSHAQEDGITLDRSEVMAWALVTL